MQIYELTSAPLNEGILKGVVQGLTKAGFDYGARKTGVNLAPYFAAPDDKDIVRIKDTHGIYHDYKKSGTRWYDASTNKEVDPITAAMLDNEARQKAATAPKTPTSVPATVPTALAPQATTPNVVEPTVAVPNKPVDYNIPAYQRKGQASPFDVKPAAPAAVNAPVAKKRTGGRTAGAPLSQTPNAIRKRAARLAKKTPAAKPIRKSRGQNLTKQQQDYIAAINARQPQSMAENKYATLEKMLSQALNAQGYTK